MTGGQIGGKSSGLYWKTKAINKKLLSSNINQRQLDMSLVIKENRPEPEGRESDQSLTGRGRFSF